MPRRTHIARDMSSALALSHTTRYSFQTSHALTQMKTQSTRITVASISSLLHFCKTLLEQLSTTHAFRHHATETDQPQEHTIIPPQPQERRARAMADILVAMAQYARRVAEQESFLQDAMAPNHESNPSLASNAEIQTAESQQSDAESKPESNDGTAKSKAESVEKRKPRFNRVPVKLASLEAEPGHKSSKDKEWVLSLTRRQFKDIVKRIRHSLDALSEAEPVETTMTLPREGNKGAFRLLNKTIQINNLLVNHKSNEKMVPILKDFLRFARIVLGGDIYIEETEIDPETPRALSKAMGLLEKAYEELEAFKQPDPVDEELLQFRKRKGISFDKDNLRDPGNSDEEKSDEGEHVRKKAQLSGRSTEDATKKASKAKAEKEDSDEDERVRKKAKLGGRGTKDKPKKASKTKGKRESDDSSEEYSDEDEPVRKKSKLSGKNTKDITKKTCKKKSKK
jgi:hypothetical protein